MIWRDRVKGHLHDAENIKGFFGPYRFLSNFEPCLVEFEGLTYPSTEAAYQAAKCKDLLYRKSFLHLTAAQAKKEGRNVRLREDWEYVKLKIMREVLISKFAKNTYLMEKLLATGDKYLEETNWWGDRFWGVAHGEGENHLGRILMQIRTEFKSL